MPKALVSAPLDARPQVARSRRLDPKVLWRNRAHPVVGSVKTWFAKLTPARRFQVASLVVLLMGMLATGWWMDHQIETAEERKAMEKEIMNTVDKELGAIARPGRILFVNQLPKTRSGKMLRRSIQAIAEGQEPGDLTTLDDPATIQYIQTAVEEIKKGE